MTRLAKIFCGITLLSVPTIMYGGYFLLTVLSGQNNIELTEFQKSMFKAGHGHAGLLVILSLIAQILIDHATLSKPWKLMIRIGFPLSAILVSGGFFAAAIGTNVTSPNNLIAILYVGIVFLLTSLVALGIGLIRKEKTT
jgi:Ni,Fe-hydrogenase I cytochrome b subunit